MSNTVSSPLYFRSLLFAILLALCAFPAPCAAQMLFSRAEQVSSMLDKIETAMANAAAAAEPGAPVVLLGQAPVRMVGEEQAARDVNAAAARQFSSSRENRMDEAMKELQIELTFKYLITGGRQIFVLKTDDTNDSRLNYQNKGYVPVIDGEIRYGKLALGGRYGGSGLSRKENTDEDWGLWFDIDGDGFLEETEYNIAYSDCKARIQFWDANLYYTISESDYRDETNPVIETLTFDVFGGYQWYRGRYAMVDPMHAFYILYGGDWYEAVGYPADIGLNSPYKITYQGPRAGFRVRGTSGRVSAKASLAFSYLKTRAHGYWNLRDYSFWQYGDGGYGIDLNLESTYALTRDWSIGLGYEYMGLYQEKMRVTGIQPGYEYYDENWIRDANNKTYGVSLILRYTW